MFYHTISQSPDWELEKGMFVISWIIVHVPNLEIGNEMERNEMERNEMETELNSVCFITLVPNLLIGN